MASILEIDSQLIGEEETFLWLSRGDLEGETENEIIAAQDLVLKTQTHREYRLCQKDETINHIVSVANNGKTTIYKTI